jgi:hypothetical protein
VHFVKVLYLIGVCLQTLPNFWQHGHAQPPAAMAAAVLAAVRLRRWSVCLG